MSNLLKFLISFICIAFSLDSVAQSVIFSRNDFKKFYPAIGSYATSSYSERGFIVEVSKDSPAFHSVQMMANPQQDITKDDVLYVRFKARCLSSANENQLASITVFFQEKTDPWRKCLVQQFAPKSQWQEFSIAFNASRNHTSGQSALVFGFGGAGIQSVEIADITFTNYKNLCKISDLPQSLLGSERILDPWEIKSISRGFGEPRVTCSYPSENNLVLDIKEETQYFYSLQMTKTCPNQIKKGDVLYLCLKARCTKSLLETGEGNFVVFFQQNKEPWEKSLSVQLSPSQDWVEYKIPFNSQQDYLPNEGSVCLGFGGFGIQTVEIADVEFSNFGTSVKLENLPKTSFKYKGMEENALWRLDADARIEKYRKSDIFININSQDSQINLDSATLEVELIRHAFPFASVANMYAWNGEQAEKFKSVFAQNFTAGGTENALKWPSMGDAPISYPNNRSPYNFLNWMQLNKLPVRGHVLLWGNFNRMPAKAKEYQENPEALRNYINNHVDEATNHFKQWVNEWDVLNEPYVNKEVANILGEDYYIELFKRARKNLPNAALFLNDYGMLTSASLNNPHADYVFELAKKLRDANSGISGIGFQSHFGGVMTPPERVYEILERFAALGLDLKITEFDIDTPDEELQAAYTRDFLTICFSHPKVKGFQMWGFWSKAHWKPQAAMFDDNWNPRLNAIQWQNLIFKKWHTYKKFSSPKVAKIRGFKGEYKITLTLPDGNSIIKFFNLGDGSAVINLNCKKVESSDAVDVSITTVETLSDSAETSQNYSKWAVENFGESIDSLPPQALLMAATPFSDGFSNLAKYALALNPKKNAFDSPNTLPQVKLSEGKHMFEFTQATNTSDVKVIPMWSPDMLNWYTDVVTETTSLDQANSTKKNTISAPITSPSTFFKLHIFYDF